jgi:hypothetical protein
MMGCVLRYVMWVGGFGGANVPTLSAPPKGKKKSGGLARSS